MSQKLPLLVTRMEFLRSSLIANNTAIGPWWLGSNLPRRRRLGVLHGEELARAYADMDVFVFLSRTDTYGNVVWEAAASGVPAVVTDSGGPRHIVRHRETGLVTPSASECVQNCAALLKNSTRRQAMPAAARKSTSPVVGHSV